MYGGEKLPKDYADLLELKRQIFLGGKVSKKIPFFKKIAALGYDEAEQIAALEFYRWLLKHRDADILVKLDKAITLRGQANFLRNSKELTRLSMILSDTTKREEYKE